MPKGVAGRPCIPVSFDASLGRAGAGLAPRCSPTLLRAEVANRCHWPIRRWVAHDDTCWVAERRVVPNVERARAAADRCVDECEESFDCRERPCERRGDRGTRPYVAARGNDAVAHGHHDGPARPGQALAGVGDRHSVCCGGTPRPACARRFQATPGLRRSRAARRGPEKERDRQGGTADERSGETDRDLAKKNRRVVGSGQIWIPDCMPARHNAGVRRRLCAAQRPDSAARNPIKGERSELPQLHASSNARHGPCAQVCDRTSDSAAVRGRGGLTVTGLALKQRRACGLAVASATARRAIDRTAFVGAANSRLWCQRRWTTGLPSQG